MLSLAALALFVLGTSSSTTSVRAQNADNEYHVEIRDGQFVAGCNPFKVAGWNAWEYPEASAGAPFTFGANLPEGVTGPELVRKQLEKAADVGFNTVRAWVQPVSPQYALQDAPGNFNEAALEGLDYLLDEARKNGIRVILSLTTNWSPTGGLPQYLAWAGSSNPADFYTDTQIKSWYKDLVTEVTGRVNTINGRVYSNDPTILAYDLINEPRCEGCPAGTVTTWINEMAPFVKSLAPNTLLTVGEEGFYGQANPGNPGHPGTWAAGKGQSFTEDHSSPAIDFAAIHLWADNWQDTSPDFIRRFLSSRIDTAKQLGKPLLLEEWGAFPANRDSFMRSTFTQIEDAMKSGGLQGSAFWQWYLEGQEAAVTEGGGGGLYGIYETDPIWSRIVDNARFTQDLNAQTIPGCSLADAKKADVPPLPACDAGQEGPSCERNVNECLRGLDSCDKNAACVDTDGSFTCECYYGYAGDGSTCTKDMAAIAELESKYYANPKATSCQVNIPVPYPVTAPGGLYDPLDSQQYVIDIYGGHRGSGSNVTLTDCMIACEMDPSCESFVINEVQQKCLLARGQCPNYLCESVEEFCVSKNDVGQEFEIPCGYWVSYYRFDSDVERSCAAFEEEIPLKKNIPPEGLQRIEAAEAAFAAYREANGPPLRSSDPTERDLSLYDTQ